MILADTHAHLYLEQFDADRQPSIENAIKRGVNYILLPNIDKDTIRPMLDLAAAFPGICIPMIGLHPTSVGPDYRVHLDAVKTWLQKERFCAIGEMGIDLYWDRTYFAEQKDAFRIQAALALEYDLPLVIHSRNSFDEIFELLEEVHRPGMRGVFHCFTGNPAQAEFIIRKGFMLGIGGVITYKNSGLSEVIGQIPMEHLLLETDAPFLAPVPHRGERNESAFLPEIAEKLAEIKNISFEEVAEITTLNSIRLFGLS